MGTHLKVLEALGDGGPNRRDHVVWAWFSMPDRVAPYTIILRMGGATDIGVGATLVHVVPPCTLLLLLLSFLIGFG